MKTYFWFRRDLRIEDNAGLYNALKNHATVQPIFIFDTQILSKLVDKQDARVHFLHDTITDLDKAFQAHGASLEVHYGNPKDIWESILSSNEVEAIYCNRDYEPYAKERDAEIAALASSKGASFNHFKDHVIFESEEVLKKDNTPYTVFTPYSKKWKEKAKDPYFFKPYPTDAYIDKLAKRAVSTIPSLQDMGFEPSDIEIPSKTVGQKLIQNYTQNRNFPAQKGTSMLGIHFRFGTISIREKARKAAKLNETFLNELIWRDFYSQILQAFPHVVKQAFRAKYDRIEWRDAEADFEKWKAGKTGYPMVDAGMRQLNQTGFMHNRVRMITASFLTKHLLLDWRWGEAYFAQKLLDFDLASNNGGWQWASGSGTDAAPYFRIFNPESQQKKFDSDFKYIKKWVPEYGTTAYVEPMVEHKFARARCLETYKSALNQVEP